MKKVLQILIVAALLVPHISSAQEGGKSNGFFDKHFAESPLRKKESDGQGYNSLPASRPQFNPPKIGEAAQMKQQIESMLKESPMVSWQQEIGLDPTVAAPMKKRTEEGDLTGLLRALPVRSIGGVISAMDFEHYEKNIRLLTDFAASKDFDIGTIYALGDMKIARSSALSVKVIGRGGTVHIVNNIPQGYDISLSPTWVVKTDEGEILLEAVGALEKYFNPAGQVLLREKRVPAVDKAP